MDDSYVTTGKAARALGVTINTIKSWIRKGQLEALRLPSGHFRIPASELRRLQMRRWREGWRYYEEWERAQPVEGKPLAEALQWNREMLSLFPRSGAAPPETAQERLSRASQILRVLGSV